MSTRTCPHCGTFVSVSSLHCQQCNQLLPSMLRAPSPEERQQPPGRATGSLKARSSGVSEEGGTSRLVKMFQNFAKK